MIPLKEFRRLLNPKSSANLSDVQVERIREVEHGFADAIFEMWLRDRNKPKGPIKQIRRCVRYTKLKS